LKKQLFLALVLTLLFLLPDLVFKIFYSHYLVFHPSMLKEIGALYLLSFLILSIKNYWVRFGFAFFVAALSFAQLFHFAYFHSYLMPYEISLVDQSDELFDTLERIFGFVFLPILLFVLQLAALAWVLKKSAFTFRYAWLIIVLLLAIGPISAMKRKRAYIYLPKATSFSFKNTFNALSWFTAKELFQDRKTPHFKPYELRELNTTLPHNIIVVMGESLSSKRMSLFGYPKSTTPHLEALKSRPNFLYTKGFSGGVTTDVAVPTFFTLKREPQNIAPLITNKTNLLRLAKERGYATHYATTQNLFVIGGVLADFSDEVKVFTGYDELLLDYLRSIDTNQSNFVILHQRNSHSPYEKYTPPKFYKYPFKDEPYESYMRNSYLNSLLYTDWLLSEIFKEAENMRGCTIVFATSDHGEMMGDKSEKGRFGHVYLGYEDAKVPMMIYYTKSCPASLTKELSLDKVISHYQFGKMIAKTLGYEVENPNDDGTYYINGVDIAGHKGFLKIKEKK